MCSAMPPVSGAEALIEDWVVGYATTATYRDANQSEVIIHTTSDDFLRKVPESNTDEVKPFDVETERDRLLPTIQESSPIHPETLPSNLDRRTEPRYRGLNLPMPR
jgi:hypothetical protein